MHMRADEKLRPAQFEFRRDILAQTTTRQHTIKGKVRSASTTQGNPQSTYYFAGLYATDFFDNRDMLITSLIVECTPSLSR